MYEAIFVCLGIYPNNYILADPSPEGDALINYLNNGGRLYMEGGEVWFYGPMLPNWYNFNPHFGITPQGDGIGDMGPVVGETGTFTNGMSFAYGGENLWMDRIDTTGGSFRIFHDGDNVYYCGVANDPGDYRTVGTSFELGLLTDGTAPSTRAVLLDSIMKFFGIINPADTIPPLDPPITEVEKSGTDAILKWNQVIDDTLGDPEAMDCYVVYRNVSSDFIPSSSDSIGTVVHPDTEYTDTGALTAGQNYYYLVKAVDSARNMSSKSNMGYVYNKFVNENLAATDKNWVSLGWHSGYGSVSDLVDDLSPSGDPLVKVTNLRDDQLYESWSYTTIPTPRWTGTNFAIESGRAYEMVTTVDDTLVLVGCNEPNGLIFLNENPVGTDKNWRSLPYNAVYDFVEDITDEYASFGDPLAKITNLRDDQLYESWSYTTIPIPRWTGTNFAIEAGRGYEFVTIVDTTWNPTEYSNEPIFGEVMARKGSHTPNVEMHVGTLTEPNRASVWSVMEKSSTTPQIQPQQNRDYLNAQQYVVIEKNEKIKADYREVGISHLVRGYFKVAGLERLVFTAYRPDRPHDMLTENIVGSGYAKDDAYVLFWFDVGNFKKPWQEGDEIILVIGASKNDTWHFTDLKFKLDKHVDIQELGELAFVSVSQGSQGRSETPVPIDYAFKVLPNPFVKKTRIDYALPKETAVEMVIYDVSGRQVKTLVFEMHKPGYYSTFWNGSDDRDRKTPSGVYFIKFVAGGFRIQEKILLVR